MHVRVHGHYQYRCRTNQCTTMQRNKSVRCINEYTKALLTPCESRIRNIKTASNPAVPSHLYIKCGAARSSSWRYCRVRRVYCDLSCCNGPKLKDVEPGSDEDIIFVGFVGYSIQHKPLLILKARGPLWNTYACKRRLGCTEKSKRRKMSSADVRVQGFEKNVRFRALLLVY